MLEWALLCSHWGQSQVLYPLLPGPGTVLSGLPDPGHSVAPIFLVKPCGVAEGKVTAQPHRAHEQTRVTTCAVLH